MTTTRKVSCHLKEMRKFWCLDEHECFALRRVPGRRLKNRPRGYKGGKGRGKGRKRGGFRPYTGTNYKSGSKKANCDRRTRKCMPRVANRIVTVVSRWLWVVGLRRCAGGKCVQRVAICIVMVVSRWCQGSFGWWVCGAVLKRSACQELQITL